MTTDKPENGLERWTRHDVSEIARGGSQFYLAADVDALLAVKDAEIARLYKVRDDLTAVYRKVAAQRETAEEAGP